MSEEYKFQQTIGQLKKKAFSLADFLILFFVAIIFITFIQSINRPVITNKLAAAGEIDVSKDPVQTATTASFASPIKKTIHDRTYKLYPQADYKIAGIVVGKNTFFMLDGGAEIAPIDIGLAWGKMAEPEYDKHMSYHSSGRYLSWHYKPEFPFTYQFLNSHASHNHIIPAGDNILKALKSLKNKEKVYMEGYLVNVKEKETYSWHTSLSRHDTEAGACEVFYVKKVRIGNKVYE